MAGATDVSRAAKPLVAAGVLFLDAHGRVLLVRPTYKPYWDIPGGYVEAGESPRSASEREVFEELGIRVRVGRLLSVDWAPHPKEGDKMLFIFDGAQLVDEQLDAIRFGDGEIAEYSFVTPDEVDRLTIDRLARRIHATVAAREQQQTAYLENGVAVNHQA